DPESGRVDQAVNADREGMRLASRYEHDAQAPGRADGEPVRRHPVVMAGRAGQRDVSDGAVGAGQGESFGDLGRRAASGAGYGAHAGTAGAGASGWGAGGA